VKLPELETDVNEDRTVGIFVSSLSQWEQVLIQAFKSDRYKQDPDYVRALAYTNKRVNALNAKIRAAIYGQSAPRFVMGERLMASSPVMVRETVVLANSAECEVLEVNEGRSGDWNVWFLGIKTDEGRHKLIEGAA
jgi:exodeoxyribonuclease-5